MYNYLEYFLAALFIVFIVIFLWVFVKYKKTEKFINKHF